MIYKPTDAEETETERFYAERVAKIEAAAKAAAKSDAPMKSMLSPPHSEAPQEALPKDQGVVREMKLKPGWLKEDMERASARVAEWANSERPASHTDAPLPPLPHHYALSHEANSQRLWNEEDMRYYAVAAMREVSRSPEGTEAMKAALAFYADPFSAVGPDGERIRIPDFYDELDFGDTAREALKDA